jgi:enoyl-CoA hydratase/carnithine racemase
MTDAVPTDDRSAPVLCERDGAVAVLTLNRPDRMNGWTGELETRYFDLLDELGTDDDVRAVVVTGAGRAFCAGADMAALEQISGGALAPSIATAGRPKTFPLSVPKPVIAAVNGACAGLGLVEALMCDVRIAAADAKFTAAFSKVGLIAEHGISWLLPRHVGIGNALDLLMSSRVVPAEEALRMGLVQQVCPPGTARDTALAYARELADRVSPKAMATIKAQVYRHATEALDAALADSDGLMVASLGAPDFAEGVAAFQQRRLPAFARLGEADPAGAGAQG